MGRKSGETGTMVVTLVPWNLLALRSVTHWALKLELWKRSAAASSGLSSQTAATPSTRARKHLNGSKFLFTWKWYENAGGGDGDAAVWSPGFSTHTLGSSYISKLSSPGVGARCSLRPLSFQLTAPTLLEARGRFGASRYVTEEITALIPPAHRGIVQSSSCSY